MRESKKVKVIFEDGSERVFNSSKEFAHWYCVEEGHGPASCNCNMYAKLKGTDKSYQKYGIQSVEYCE